jgi:hypothetical protein
MSFAETPPTRRISERLAPYRYFPRSRYGGTTISRAAAKKHQAQVRANEDISGTDNSKATETDPLRVKSPTLVVGTSGVTSAVEIEYVKAE